MIDHGLVRSTIKPDVIIVDEHNVWVNSNIKEVNEHIGEESEFIGFEYSMVQYTKDEYIKVLNTQLTDTQLALIELYEGLVI